MEKAGAVRDRCVLIGKGQREEGIERRGEIRVVAEQLGVEKAGADQERHGLIGKEQKGERKVRAIRKAMD